LILTSNLAAERGYAKLNKVLILFRKRAEIILSLFMVYHK